MLPTVMQSWNLDCPVIGLAWLEGPGLAVIQEQGTRTLIHLYNQQGKLIVNQLSVQWAVSQVLGHFRMQYPSKPVESS